MKKFRMFLLLIIAAISFNGCSDDSPSSLVEDTSSQNESESSDQIGDDSSETSETVFEGVVLDDDFTQYMTDLDESSFALSASTPDDMIPQSGDIICCTITDNTPYGFLGKVVSVENTSAGYLVETEEVSLEEAFESLDLDEDIDITDKIQSITDDDGNEVEFSFVDASVWDEITDETEYAAYAQSGLVYENVIKIELNFGNEAINVTGSGNIYLSLGASVNVSSENHNMSYANLNFSHKIGLSAELSAAIEKSVDLTVAKLSITLGAIAAGPIVITPKLTLTLNSGFDGKISISSNLQYNIMDVSYGFTYQNGEWSNYINNNTPDSKGWTPISLEMDGELYSSASVGVSFCLYNSDNNRIGVDIGCKMTGVASFTLDMWDLLSTSPEFYIYRTLFVEITGEIKIISKISLKASHTMEFDLGNGKTYRVFPYPEIQSAEVGDDNESIECDITWYNSSLLELDYGIVLLDEDENELVFIQQGTSSHHEYDDTVIDYTSEFTGIYDGTYYVAPYVSLASLYIYGDKIEVTLDDDNPERKQLIYIYNLTNGDNWTNNTNWYSNKPISEWYGVTVNDEGHVVSLNLEDNNLYGSIEIFSPDDNDDCYFYELEELKISNNTLADFYLSVTSKMEELVVDNCFIVELGHLEFYNVKNVQFENCNIGAYKRVDFIGNDENVQFENCNIEGDIYVNNAENVQLENCNIGGYITVNNAENVQLENCNICCISIEDGDKGSFYLGDALTRYGCENLTIEKCSFDYSVLSGTVKNLVINDCQMDSVGGTANEATITNCYMHDNGIGSNYLTFKDSTTYDTWYAYTYIKMNLIDCYCSTICKDFEDSTIIYLHNATLWKSNWDESSFVTLSCTILGSQWDSLFESDNY